MSKKRKIDRDKYKEKIAKVLILDNFNSRKQYHDINRKEWFDSVEEYILSLKSDFPEYGDFGHALQVIIHPDGLAKEFQNIPDNILPKIVTEYIINYGESSNYRVVDFIPIRELGGYFKDGVPTCDIEFFENMWDKFSNLSTRWNTTLKDELWQEILPEVESAMENVEEDDLIHFDSLEKEEMYFRSYWHYPIDNLGWTKDMLCDWYHYYCPKTILQNYYLDRYEDKYIHSLPLWSNETFYMVEVNELF